LPKPTFLDRFGPEPTKLIFFAIAEFFLTFCWRCAHVCHYYSRM